MVLFQMLGCHCEEQRDEAIRNISITDCHSRFYGFAMTEKNLINQKFTPTFVI